MNPQSVTRRVRGIAAALGCASLSAAAAMVPACGGSPTDPSTQLQVACPASKSVESPAGTPIAVQYDTPTTTGGTAPVTVTCAPASGSSFPVGTTSVTCTARDAKQKTASCNLNVTVTRVGTLSATRFMAFGDSITFGSPATPCSPLPAGASLAERIRLDAAWIRQFVSPLSTPPATSYPSVLTNLLVSRYAGQSIAVFNEGNPGEHVTDGAGTNDDTLTRLRQRLLIDAPHVLLLQEGINDINTIVMHMPDRIPMVIKALRDFVIEGRNRGVTVMIGTLLPTDPASCRGSRGYDMVAPANEQIKAMAAAEGVTVVDLYQAFGGVAAPYMGTDGLHPNPLGYETMAQAFFTAIRTKFEVPR